jgi:hypothetical protein
MVDHSLTDHRDYSKEKAARQKAAPAVATA